MRAASTSKRVTGSSSPLSSRSSSSIWCWRPRYESFRDPLIILIALPTSIFGALLPLTFGLGTGQHLHADRLGDADRPYLQARHPDRWTTPITCRRRRAWDAAKRSRKAAAVRLRPILMTTAAMVIAMVPLIVSTGAGCRLALRHRHRHRLRHDDRHAVHAVRDSGGLHLHRARASPRCGGVTDRPRPTGIHPAE